MTLTSSLLHLVTKPAPIHPKPPPHRILALPPLSTSPPNPSTLITKITFSHIFQECSKLHAATATATATGLEAHARMITSGFTPTIFVSNCLIHMYVRCCKLDYARNVFDHMPQRDTISWNAMISGYSQSGSMGIAQSLFDGMPERDSVSWNTLISAYLQNGNPHESVNLFLRMRRIGIGADRTTFAVALKACSAFEEYDMGIQIHGLTVKIALDLDVVTGSAIVDMYSKCKSLADSLRFFHGMPERNWVSWSAAIGGCVQNECFLDGLEVFIEMQREGVGVSQSVYASVFRSCAGLPSVRAGSQFHGHALKTNFSSDVVVGTAIVDMYAKGDNLGDAMRVFAYLPMHTLQTWNAIVVGFARNDRGFEAMELFQVMNWSGVGVDKITLSAAFSACSEARGYLQGLQVHSLAIKTSLASDICVRNAILDMYGKCRALAEARNVFAEMDRRDAVSWNAIITALEQNGRWEETLAHFHQMLRCGMEPDEFTYGSVLKACAGLQSLESGLEVHDKIIKFGLGLDSFIGCALVDMYCKCGAMDEAHKIHSRAETQTVVSWNAIISGFSLQKRSEEAQNLFFEMIGIGLKPDKFTYATVLDTCANLAIIGLGKQIHGQTIKQELQKDVFISGTLVDLYAKCGNVQDSLLMFEKMVERDFVSWNAMICGYAQHGLGVEALAMFERMQAENMRPNHATFVAVLRACGHVGLADEGMRYFSLMTHRYELEPQLEHYSCMVDIIGRCKGVHEALELIDAMPFEPDAIVWRTLLSVCKIHGDVKVAELAADKIRLLDPEDSAVYVLQANIYAEAGKREQVADMRREMRRRRLKKEPGCSWIEVKSEMHTFLVGDMAHPRCGEVYERLDELIGEMKLAGYLPEIDLFVDDEKEAMRD